MSFLSRIFKKAGPPPPNVWPNHEGWSALKDGLTIETGDGLRTLSTVACGELALPSGRLVACDPFVGLSPTGTPFVETPRGKFPVTVTLADVSEKQDATHLREAYASITFSNTAEAYRKPIVPAGDGEARPDLKADEFIGFGVDAGTACFVDETFLATCMPEPGTWYESLFENEREDCWFRRMDDPAHIRVGIANIALPLAKNGENLILFHSGWGDGYYPVVGSFDSTGQLMGVHIDFLVVS